MVGVSPRTVSVAGSVRGAVGTMSEEERTLEEIRREMRVGFTRLETKIDDLERLVLRLARKVDELDHKIDEVAASVRVVSE